jgi:hypothetical protein
VTSERLNPPRTVNRLFTRLAVVIALGTPAGALLAADGAPAESRAERKARLEQWCTDNPEKCREAKAKLEQWREQCKADPEKCRAERETLRGRSQK